MDNEVLYPFRNDAVFCKVLERDPNIAKQIMLLAAGKELEGINLDSLTVEKQEQFDRELLGH